jgi:hypothetical protein
MLERPLQSPKPESLVVTTLPAATTAPQQMAMTY